MKTEAKLSSETCGCLRSTRPYKLHSEDGCNLFLRNVRLSPNCKTLQPRRLWLHIAVGTSNLTNSFQFFFYRFCGHNRIRWPLERQTRLINSAPRTIQNDAGRYCRLKDVGHLSAQYKQFNLNCYIHHVNTNGVLRPLQWRASKGWTDSLHFIQRIRSFHYASIFIA